MADINRNSHKIIYRKYTSAVKYILMALSVIIITYSLPKQAKFKYEFEKGNVWLHDDLISPYNYPIKKTQEQIKEDKENVLKAALPIYEYDEQVFQDQAAQYQAEFEAKWKNAGFKDDENKQFTFTIGLNILKDIYQKGIIGLNKKYQKDGDTYIISLVRNGFENQISTGTLNSQSQAALAVTNQVLESKNSATDFLISLLKDRITPNVIYNERLTEKIEQQALESISSTRGMVQKGELIVSKESTVTEEIYQKLKYLTDEKITGN